MVKVIINDQRIIAMKPAEDKAELKTQIKRFAELFEDEVRKQVGLPTIIEEMAEEAQKYLNTERSVEDDDN